MRTIARDSYIYTMSGVAIGCIWLSVVLASIFAPDMVSGAQHERITIVAVTAWLWGALSTGAVAMAAQESVRAGTATKASWNVLGLGVAGLWLAVIPVAVFTPVAVTGTDPTELPLAGIGAPILALIATRFLCSFVLSAAKVRSGAPPGAEGSTPVAEPPVVHAPEESTAARRLRELAQLRDAGVITVEEFEAKKEELLARI